MFSTVSCSMNLRTKVGGRQPCTGKQKPKRSPGFNFKWYGLLATSGKKTTSSPVFSANFSTAHLVLPVPEK